MPIQVTNLQDFEKWAERTLLSEVYDKFISRKTALENAVRSLIHPFLLASDEYQSLLNGRLRTSFGIEDTKTALDEITNAVLDSTFAVVSRDFTSVTCTIHILKDDFSEVLSLGSAKYTYQGRAKTLPGGKKLLGGKIEIPWLQWLLFSGNSQIISDSQVASVKATPFSRTGSTIMIQPKNPKGFSVPSEFSGTEEDNWLTRVLIPAKQDVVQKMFEFIR